MKKPAGEWKEPCDGDGNATVLYMPDANSIKTRNEGMCGNCEACVYTRCC